MWIIQIGTVGTFSWHKYLKYLEPVPAVSGLCTINMRIKKHKGIFVQFIVIIKASSQTESLTFVYCVLGVKFTNESDSNYELGAVLKKQQQSTVKHEAWS